jgi:hypothetical protein
MLTKLKDDFNNLPSWARILLSIGVAASTIKWFPIIELLELFLLIVVVPLGFLTFVGLLSKETSNTIVSTWTLVCNTLRTQVKDAAKAAATGTTETAPTEEEA